MTITAYCMVDDCSCGSRDESQAPIAIDVGEQRYEQFDEHGLWPQPDSSRCDGLVRLVAGWRHLWRALLAG